MLLGACFKHFSITNLQILLAASSSSLLWQIIIANKWSRSDHIVLLIFVVKVYGWYPLILMSKCPSFDVYRCWWCFDDIWGPLNLSCHTMLSWILPCADAWPAPWWWCLAGQRHYAVKGSSLWWHLEGRSQSAGSQVMTRSVFTVCSNMQCRRTDGVLWSQLRGTWVVSMCFGAVKHYCIRTLPRRPRDFPWAGILQHKALEKFSCLEILSVGQYFPTCGYTLPGEKGVYWIISSLLPRNTKKYIPTYSAMNIGC